MHLLYHADKKMIENTMIKSINLKDYEQFENILRKLDVNLLSFDTYQNIILLDYSLSERKMAILYLNPQ